MTLGGLRPPSGHGFRSPLVRIVVVMMPPMMMMVVMMVPVRQVPRSIGREGFARLGSGEAETQCNGDEGNEFIHSCATDSTGSRSLVV